MKRTLNLVILVAAFISGIKSFPWLSTQFLIFFGLWIWALVLDLSSAGRSRSEGEPVSRKEGRGGLPVIAPPKAETPVAEPAGAGEAPATSGPKTPEEAARSKFRLSAAAPEKAAQTVFGREYAAFTFEWTNVFLKVMTPSPDWDGRIRGALAEYCALTGITQAQIYAIDPTRPQTMVLAAQMPPQSRPAKRPSFEYAGTSFEKLVAESVQVVPDPKRLDVMPPVPTKIASPLLHGTKLIGLVNVEEAPMGLIEPPLEKLYLYQIGQIVGSIVGGMMDQAALETRNRELEAEVKKLSTHQQKLQHTAEFLDQEVDRQYFENIDLAKDRERLVNSFQKFVSPVLIERIRNDPTALQPGGSKQLVTVFFSDIRGFTEMSERMDPARIVVQLNEYFNAMTEIVLAFGGMLDKYVGDEIMALFGAPLPLPDAPVRAIYCALEMTARLGILHRKWAKEGFPEFAVGFGITIGEVTAGFIGSEKVLSYTAIGDTVNLASRLCANAQSSEILINSDVAKLLGDALKLEALPPLLVKGKAEPVEVFRVLGPGRLPDFLPPGALIADESRN